MSSLLSFLGINAAAGAATPDHTAAYLIANILWSHTLSSSRAMKWLLRIDNHVSPREDSSKFGPRAVADGKITQRQLDMLKRNEAAHANSMEHYAVFATAMILAKIAGLPASQINYTGFLYTALRLLFFANYVFSSTLTGAALRPLFWWGSNIVCLRLIWAAGKTF